MRTSGSRSRLSWDRVLAILIAMAVGGVVAWGVVIELEASPLQSRLFSKLASGFSYTVEPGPNADAHFPQGGPYDERLGYALMPSYIQSLETAGLRGGKSGAAVARSCQFHRLWRLRRLPGEGAERPDPLRPGRRSALPVAPSGTRLRRLRARFPRLAIDTLLFVENRELLDDRYPTRNPAVEWDRFAAAAANAVAGIFHAGNTRFGGSTLATQIEKYRHSPEGRTERRRGQAAADHHRQRARLSGRAGHDCRPASASSSTT